LDVVVDGSNGPGDANTEEDVDSVGASDVTNGGISVGILLGSDLGGEGICGENWNVILQS